MVLLFCMIATVLWLAWSNGANDNFKGVATLYGSGEARFRVALAWATGATVLGSAASFFVGQMLVRKFTGKGIVADEVIDGAWLIAVAGSGALTILLATLLGMPTSTTHALAGALVGAALVADAGGVAWHRVLTTFAQPLLLGPALALGATALLYLLLRRIRVASGIERHTCVCVGQGKPVPILRTPHGAAFLASDASGPVQIGIGQFGQCVERYGGRVVGIDAQTAVSTMHYLSAAGVCFARAVNDTPKVAALLLAASAATNFIPGPAALGVVTLAMAAGGLIQSRKVAQTMSKRITDLNPGQGLTANLVTALLVLTASGLALPVSTTHVSCGSIFAIGLVSGRCRWKTLAQIVTTWLTTLPAAALLGALFYWVAQSIT